MYEWIRASERASESLTCLHTQSKLNGKTARIKKNIKLLAAALIILLQQYKYIFGGMANIRAWNNLESKQRSTKYVMLHTMSNEHRLFFYVFRDALVVFGYFCSILYVHSSSTASLLLLSLLRCSSCRRHHRLFQRFCFSSKYRIASKAKPTLPYSMLFCLSSYIPLLLLVFAPTLCRLIICQEIIPGPKWITTK